MRIAKSLLLAKPPGRANAVTAAILREMRDLLAAGRAEDAMRLALDSLAEGRDAPLLELARSCAVAGRHTLTLAVLDVIGAARPDILRGLDGDASFAGLADDPRFLQMTGRL